MEKELKPEANPVRALPPRLLEILKSLPDQQFAGKLRQVYQEAAKAIAGLAELELGKYEVMVDAGSPDLSLWEELAPVIRDTIMDVNALLASVRSAFPTEIPGGIADMIGLAIEESSGPEEETAQLMRRMDEVTNQIHVLASVLAAEITNLGERIRSPQVVSDRWNLMADLQEFRGKFRQAIGEMIFVSASQFGYVSRRDVIPGYVDDVRHAINLRRGVTDLARVVGAYAGKAKTSAESELPAIIDALAQALDAFGKSRPYWTLRAQDKRRVVEFRHELTRLKEQGSVTRPQVQPLLDDFAFVVQGMTLINRREALVEHDRELLAACAVRIEEADASLSANNGQAARLLADAVKMAADLYGRDPALDGYLRKARKRDLTQLPVGEVPTELETFRGFIVGAIAR